MLIHFLEDLTSPSLRFRKGTKVRSTRYAARYVVVDTIPKKKNRNVINNFCLRYCSLTLFDNCRGGTEMPSFQSFLGQEEPGCYQQVLVPSFQESQSYTKCFNAKPIKKKFSNEIQLRMRIRHPHVPTSKALRHPRLPLTTSVRSIIDVEPSNFDRQCQFSHVLLGSMAPLPEKLRVT